MSPPAGLNAPNPGLRRTVTGISRLPYKKHGAHDFWQRNNLLTANRLTSIRQKAAFCPAKDGKPQGKR